MKILSTSLKWGLLLVSFLLMTGLSSCSTSKASNWKYQPWTPNHNAPKTDGGRLYRA